MWTPTNTNKTKSQQIQWAQNLKKSSIPAHLKQLLNFGRFIYFSFPCGFDIPIYRYDLRNIYFLNNTDLSK